MSNFTVPHGSVTLNALAVLENPRAVPNSVKTFLFDAHLFCFDEKDPETPGIMASLRYFNSRNYNFDEVGAYFITAHVVRVVTSDNRAPVVASSGELTNDDYCLVGDIISLIPAQLDQADQEHSPYVVATGYITRALKDERTRTLTFDLAPEPYTNAYKDYNKLSGVKKASLPLTCILSESPRWKFQSMPNLQPGHVISVSGHLTRVIRDNENIQAFQLTDIEQLGILGKTTIPVASDSSAEQSPNGSKRKNGPVKWSFASPVAKRQRTESSSSQRGSSNAPRTPRAPSSPN